MKSTKEEWIQRAEAAGRSVTENPKNLSRETLWRMWRYRRPIPVAWAREVRAAFNRGLVQGAA